MIERLDYSICDHRVKTGKYDHNITCYTDIRMSMIIEKINEIINELNKDKNND